MTFWIWQELYQSTEPLFVDRDTRQNNSRLKWWSHRMHNGHDYERNYSNVLSKNLSFMYCDWLCMVLSVLRILQEYSWTYNSTHRQSSLRKLPKKKQFLLLKTYSRMFQDCSLGICDRWWILEQVKRDTFAISCGWYNYNQYRTTDESVIGSYSCGTKPVGSVGVIIYLSSYCFIHFVSLV